MAENTALFERYLSCHVCSETFRDPVSLSCNHSFCSSCLQKFWEQTGNKNCPICKRKSSKDPGINFSLKELAESFTGRQKPGSSETETGAKQLMVCSKHQEDPKLFCEDEQRAVCPVYSISAVEEELQKDNVSFLSSYKATQSRARGQRSLPDPQLVSGALIDVAKHLGNLSFRVWEKMKDQVKFSPIILDPNTAERSLCLSDDLTRVTCGDTWRQLPDNPERNIKYGDVFGSEGFSSGKYSWEVEVGDHSHWNVGLVKESVDRKGKIYASPKYGIWCLRLRDGEYTNGFPGQTLTVNKSLQRIRVQLDYDRGEVSFYDSEEKSHIYTHTHTFTEKLFPYFTVGKSADAKTSEIKICQTDISV
ncbi:nuclear factor 7, ovary-like [Poecilia formosa]|uniref:nuclear factor 7, ovary-like n=1 Tax=Poecilia formosa TaxID=48698 RepID=UPI0004443651|nr:PREDICTED: nuclear factor 7, ovary-like [Poecilia formosa]